jgi:hypothetical protein
MGNQAVKGYTDVIGKHGLAVYDHTGPASYSQATGDILTAQSLGLRSIDFVANENSGPGGIYEVNATSPSNVGSNPATQSLHWYFATSSSVATVAQNAAGIGMTPGVTVPIVFGAPPAGGTQATGTLTVLTATTFSYQITNPGKGYTSAPTAVVSGTGGTPVTLTTTLSAAGAEATTGANLSGLTVRIMAIGG